MNITQKSIRKGFSQIDYEGYVYAGVPEWSKGQGLGPCDIGLRAFESLLLHIS